MQARVQIFDRHLGLCNGPGMATPNGSESVPVSQEVDVHTPSDESDLLAEILAAEADFERGDYIELTMEQLEHCAATGESPWPDDESRSQARRSAGVSLRSAYTLARLASARCHP